MVMSALCWFCQYDEKQRLRLWWGETRLHLKDQSAWPMRTLNLTPPGRRWLEMTRITQVATVLQYQSSAQNIIKGTHWDIVSCTCSCIRPYVFLCCFLCAGFAYVFLLSYRNLDSLKDNTSHQSQQLMSSAATVSVSNSNTTYLPQQVNLTFHHLQVTLVST